MSPRIARRRMALAVGLAILLTGCLQGGGPGASSLTSSTTATLMPSPSPTSRSPSPSPSPSPTRAPLPIGHVFVLLLENEDFNTTFPASGDAPSPYLAHDLRAAGRFLPDYFGIGHASLGNYIAMVSGQAPNPATQGNCSDYVEFVGTSGGADGQATGQGCVFPKQVLNLGDQLDGVNVTWRMYAEDMANVGAPKTCRHQPIGSRDPWQGSSDAGDQYATRHVPFVYFHSLIDDQARCDDRVVDLTNLTVDLGSLNSTRAFNFITPDVCSDGHDATCVNPDQRGGYAGIDGFLHVWIPRIQDSTAYQKDGLILVTFDEAEASTSDACCHEPTGPNTQRPGISGPGGGRVGAILLAPCLEAGTVDDTPYNHYSFLRTMEDFWGLAHLGYAGMDGLVPIAVPGCSVPAPSR